MEDTAQKVRASQLNQEKSPAGRAKFYVIRHQTQRHGTSSPKTAFLSCAAMTVYTASGHGVAKPSYSTATVVPKYTLEQRVATLREIAPEIKPINPRSWTQQGFKALIA